MSSERERVLARARHVLARYLEPERFGPPAALEIAAHHLHGEPVAYAEAVQGPWEPFEVGGRWGADWDTTWFRLRGRVPEDWVGAEVDLAVDLGFHGTVGFGGEGLIWTDGAPLAGVNPRHQEVTLVEHARGGEQVEVYIEAAANPEGGGQELLAPQYHGPPRLVLGRAEMAVRRVEVDQLCLDMRVLIELAESLPPEGRRTAELLRALREACAAVGPRAVEESAGEARKVLSRALARRGAPGRHRVSAIGHAHIDTAWLWPLRETPRKCARTFSTALALMEDYPGYYFACSQAQQHAWVREQYPELFARIRDRVSEGRFEPVGSMWVEPDCNVPSGESLVRQFLYGKRFFAEVYGADTRECWLPDAFGYPASLPQIMAQAGVDTFISQKMSWNSVNKFPHHSFLWEGIDGTRVLAHFPPSDTYNGDFSVAQLRYGEQNFLDHQVSGVSLYPFGYGDGGGGPTAEMLERAARVADLDGLPEVTIEPVRDFVSRLAAGRDALATWVGELYLELHRGTYTTQARVKAGNRRCEMALRDAELWSAGLEEMRAVYPAEQLADAWRTLLLHQFHDILPGSSINWVYKDTASAHASVLAAAQELSGHAETALAAVVDTSSAEAPVVLLNACSHDRDEVVALPAGTQRAHDGGWLARVRVPSCGWAVHDLAQLGRGPAGDVPGPVEAGPGRLENALLRVELDGDGVLRSVYDKVAGREVLAGGTGREMAGGTGRAAPAGGGRGNLLQLQDDEPVEYDAWDIDEFSGDRVEDVSGLDGIEVIESGPLRAGIRLRRRFGSSSLAQVVWLHAGSARIDFETEVDWHERHRLLKVAFPVAVRAMEATYEIQFGHVRRPTHTNTSWDQARFEVCAHRWADLSEAGYGVALLNDSKYGYDIRANVMRLSLLRSPTSPDPEADQGWHPFTYSLLPHSGGIAEGKVVEEGWALNSPLRAVAGAATPAHGAGARPSSGSLVSFDRPGVVLEALKRSEGDSDVVVLRAYEAHGARGRVGVRVGWRVGAAFRGDLLESGGEAVPVEDGGDHSVVQVDIGPFEIVTLLLRAAAAGS